MNSDSNVLVSTIRMLTTNYGPNSRSTVIINLRNCSPAPDMGWNSTDAQTSARVLVERSDNPPTPVPFLSEPIVSVSGDLGNLKLEGKIPRGFDNVLYISHAALGNSGMKRNNMTPFW